MENCLVTKLKGTVDNDSLLKVGEYKMHFNYKSAVSYKLLGSNGTATILGTNNYYFTQGGQQTKTVSYGNSIITFPAGEYDVLFTNKYGLIGCDGGRQFDLEIFTFCSRLQYISGAGFYGNVAFLKGKRIEMGFLLSGDNNHSVVGNLSDMAAAVKNANCQLNMTDIVGDIALLGNTGNKALSVVYSSYITGSIEGLVAALTSDPDNPFTSGTKNVHIANSGVTINGSVQSIADTAIKLVMEDPTHWYYPNNNNDYIDNPNYQVTIYAKNPTAAQISAWEANNNTVVVLS